MPKIKTHRGAAKRFGLTKNGKVKKNHKELIKKTDSDLKPDLAEKTGFRFKTRVS